MSAQILQDILDRHLARGELRAASLLLKGRAQAQDPEALFVLATWRIAGNIIPRDLTEARELLRCAAELGHEEATVLYIKFLANGTGGTPLWAQARKLLMQRSGHDSHSATQCALLAEMQLDENGDPTKPIFARELSASPAVWSSEALLTAAECEYLRSRAEPALQPSLVVDPASGRLIPHPIRRSDGMAFGVFDEDLVVNAINRRIAALSGTAVEQGEPLQVLRYRPGGEYRPHLDAIAGLDNQRVITVLLYLNDSYLGGETQFVSGLTFKGHRGDALMFQNALEGRPDPASQHAGRMVRSGEKVIASRWIRNSDFTFPPPVPTLPHFG